MIKHLVLLALSLAILLPARANVLEDYVRSENEALSYEVTKEVRDLGIRVLSVRLTSQVWRGHEWKHWLTVFIPPAIDPHKKGILLIEGGSNRDGRPDPLTPEGRMIGMTSLNLRAPVALLLQVPSQPLYGNLSEDDLIAHTFDEFLKGGDDDWPLLLPMVKSATAAMDALQKMAGEGVLKTATGIPCPCEQFIVGGASKRGWTTWLTAAVDQRVCALAPSVIDVLNMAAQMRQQRKSYGAFSNKITPYTSREIMSRLETPRGAELRRIVDPYEYRERLQQPKLLLLGTNDPYWTVDAARLYYPELRGPKAMYYLPNAGHGLGLGVLPTLNSFFVSVLGGHDYPEIETVPGDGDGAVTVKWDRAGRATLWSAQSADRDFRKATWTPRELDGERSVTVAQEKPEEGWRASFVTVTFPGLRDGDPEFQLSTPVRVLPEAFPHQQ